MAIATTRRPTTRKPTSMRKPMTPQLSFETLTMKADARRWVKPLYIEPMKAEEERIGTNRNLVQRRRARLARQQSNTDQ